MLMYFSHIKKNILFFGIGIYKLSTQTPVFFFTCTCGILCETTDDTVYEILITISNLATSKTKWID